MSKPHPHPRSASSALLCWVQADSPTDGPALLVPPHVNLLDIGFLVLFFVLEFCPHTGPTPPTKMTFHNSICNTLIRINLTISYACVFLLCLFVKSSFPRLCLTCSASCITAEKNAFYSRTQVLFPVAVHGLHFVF